MAERWQYGVAFSDGSMGWHWSGRTSREHAQEVIDKWPRDAHLVRRAVDLHGHPIGEPEPVEEEPTTKPAPRFGDLRAQPIFPAYLLREARASVALDGGTFAILTTPQDENDGKDLAP
jgi:hypothetical protein